MNLLRLPTPRILTVKKLMMLPKVMHPLNLLLLLMTVVTQREMGPVIRQRSAVMLMGIIMAQMVPMEQMEVTEPILQEMGLKKLIALHVMMAVTELSAQTLGTCGATTVTITILGIGALTTEHLLEK
jgi:hypothetical protein